MDETIAVVGAGLIGRAWAVVFARAGFAVRLQDTDAEALARSEAAVAETLADLEQAGLCGKPERILRLITRHAELETALEGVTYVQECGPEDVGLKRRLFSALEAAASSDAILASSTSGITATDFAGHLDRPERCLVAHPVNPPSLVPLVEVVPGARTGSDCVARTLALMRRVGQVPIHVRKEIEGFVLNRLQGALLTEALRLYRDGYVSAEDLDRTVSDGLGRRWSFMGPFETIDLNAPGGVVDYARRYGPLYTAIDRQRHDTPPWQPEVLERLAVELRAVRPAGALEKRRAWRDRRLMALSVHLGDAASESET